MNAAAAPIQAAGTSVISAVDVHRRYGVGDASVAALRGVSLEIPNGQFAAVLSDNGLTLLRRQHIGFIFQFFNLLPMLTAEENILLPLRLAGEQVDSAWANEIIDKVGLGDRRRHRPSELSGGQQQRVAIARALASRPTVMFADEPTGNLDSQTSAEILVLLRDMVTTYGQTTVMVTHDANAAAMADRVLFLADGQIVRDQGRSEPAAVLAAMSEVSAL